MHIPDGVVGPGVGAAAGVMAEVRFGVAVARARRYLTDRLVPMAALVTAFGPTRELLGSDFLLAEHRLGLLAGLRIADLEER